MKRIYLDYAASTPVDPEVKKAMNPYFGKIFGNPGSIHWFGQEASAVIFDSRQKIAKALGAKYDEIFFTGSATEANNLALRGSLNSLKFKRLNSEVFKPKIIVSAIEHESVLKTAQDLERSGVKVSYIPVDKEGIVRVDILKKELDKDTVLVSVMYVNNETGTIQPIKEIGEIIKSFKAQYPTSKIQFHTDAVQALQFLDCNVENLGVDFMTISAHKIYGPKGIGVLYVKNPKLSPLLTGGGQESGLRSGTENTPYIVGFGKAIEISEKLKLGEFKRLNSLKKYFWKEIKKNFPKAELNGSSEFRIPNILNIYFPGASAQDRCIELDLKGVAVSPGVACAAHSAEPSYVIKALGFSNDRASSSLRFSFGRPTTKKDLKNILKLWIR